MHNVATDEWYGVIIPTTRVKSEMTSCILPFYFRSYIFIKLQHLALSMPRPRASSVTCLRATIVSLFIVDGELMPNTRTPKANWFEHSILGCGSTRYCSQTGSWIRDDIETLPALLTLYEENKLVSPTKGPVTQSLHTLFDGCLNKLLNNMVDLFRIWYHFSIMLRHDVIFRLAMGLLPDT